MLKKYFYLLMTGFLFGSQFILTLKAMQGYTTLDVAFMRVLFGFIAVSCLAPLFLSKESFNISKGQIKFYQYAIIGFFEGALPCILVPWGQQYLNTGIAAVIISTMPMFVMIFGPLLIKNEFFNSMNIVSILLGFAGVFILIHPTGGGSLLAEIVPELSVLLASASWALSLVLIKRLPEQSPLILTRNILFAASIEIGLIWLVWGDPSQFQLKTSALISGISLGIFNSGIVYIFYVLLIRAAGVNFAAFSNYLVPIVGVSLGIIFLHESYKTYELIGFLIIMTGLFIHTIHDIVLYKKNRDANLS
ncbi:DMT family transporter [Legionella pneumophila]